MRIIALRGGGSCGKTATLNLVYDDLISNGAVSTNKTKLGGDIRDFEDILNYKGKTVAFFTMGDYSRNLIDAIVKYDNLKVDILICASNIRFKRPITKIRLYPHDLVNKSIISANNTSSINYENNKDAQIICGLI